MRPASTQAVLDHLKRLKGLASRAYGVVQRMAGEESLLAREALASQSVGFADALSLCVFKIERHFVQLARELRERA